LRETAYQSNTIAVVSDSGATVNASFALSTIRDPTTPSLRR
jgi:hypothetical protein